MSGPYAPVTQEKLDSATDRPLPAAQRLKTNIDDFLTGNVVEPLAQRGYPNLGAALATVPSVAAEMMIPSTTGELQGAVIPLPGMKKALKKIDDLELFHGSKTGLSEIKERHNPVGIDFGGIFASPSEVSAASHGDNLYRTKINKADVLDQQKINEIMDDKKIEDIFKKSTRLDSKSLTFEEDLDLLKESVLQNKNIFDLDLSQENKIKHLVRTDDLGEASWELQTIKGKIAKALGYKAVEMPDEHGMSYLVFPGNKIEKIER